jgi:CRISPR-associated protein (TIGR03984 family)
MIMPTPNNPERKIQTGQRQLTSIDSLMIGRDPIAWLLGKAEANMILLAHADDGVIWGKVSSGDEKQFLFPALSLFSQVPFRSQTLQMARLFNAQREVFLWRVDEGVWRARVLSDGTGERCLFLDEAQVLWGTRVAETQGGFSLMEDGEQRLHHAVPLALADRGWEKNRRPLRLQVRHYLEAEDNGWLRIEDSRLVQVKKEE